MYAQKHLIFQERIKLKKETKSKVIDANMKQKIEERKQNSKTFQKSIQVLSILIQKHCF